MKKFFKILLKTLLIIIISLISVTCIALFVSFMYIPDQMGTVGEIIADITGFKIETVCTSKAIRGNIVDFHNKILVTGNERFHPYGNLAESTLGYVKKDGDTILKSGVEGAFCRGLNGRDGYNVVRTHIFSENPTVVRTSDKKDGPTVYISLDIKMQAFVDSLLRKNIIKMNIVHDACVVIACTHSGGIRTMVNLNRKYNGEYQDSCNTAISFPYTPGMLLAPVSVLASIKCDSTRKIGNCDLSSMSDLSDISDWLSFHDYSNVVEELLTGGTSQLFVAIEGLAPIKLNENLKSYPEVLARSYLSCGYGISASALTLLKLYTAIARGGKGIGLRLFGLMMDDENAIINDEIMLAPIEYHLCTKEQADTLTLSMKQSLNGDILHKAKYEVAGLYGNSLLPDVGGKYYVGDEDKNTVQVSFAGFFPADKPAYSIICMVNMSPLKSGLDDVEKCISKIVYEIINSDIMAESVKYSEKFK